MPVLDLGMPMGMHVSRGRIARQMLVLVVGVVHMSVAALHQLMFVLSSWCSVRCSQNSHAHQETSDHELDRERLVKELDGRNRAKEWRG